MTKVPAREGRDGREGRGDFNYNKQTPYEELGHGISSYFSPSTKLPLNQRKRENSSLLRYKNTKKDHNEHKGTKVVKDGED